MQEAAKGMVGVNAKTDPAKQGEGFRNVWQKMLADMKGIADGAEDAG